LTANKEQDTITAMNTLNTLTNSVLQVINEGIIDDLLDLGYDHESAIKVVTEFDGYDFVMDAEDNPSDF
jgi:hypothetical protein